MLALRAYLRKRLEAGVTSINWTEIKREVACDFMVNREHIADLMKGFMQDGDIWVYGNGARGGLVERYESCTRDDEIHCKDGE